MKIKREDLRKIFRELNLEEIPIAISKLQGAVHTSIHANSLIFKEKFFCTDIENPEFNKFKYFNIYLEGKEELLIQNRFPLLFLPTDFNTTLAEAHILVEKIALLNELSTRKREIVFVKDMLKQKTKKSPVVLYAASHEPLTFRNLARLKKEFLNKDEVKLKLSYAENGILVYSQKVEKDYAMLIDVKRAIEKLQIPYTVITDINIFIKKFKENSTRLSIITYSQESYKSKLLYVMLKNQDSIAKILELDELKRESPTPLHERIKSFYYADYFESVAEIKSQKNELAYEKEARLKKELFKLINHYDPVKHIRLEYIIHKLSTHYDTSRLNFFLNKLAAKKNTL